MSDTLKFKLIISAEDKTSLETVMSADEFRKLDVVKLYNFMKQYTGSDKPSIEIEKTSIKTKFLFKKDKTVEKTDKATIETIAELSVFLMNFEPATNAAILASMYTQADCKLTATFSVKKDDKEVVSKVPMNIVQLPSIDFGRLHVMYLEQFDVTEYTLQIDTDTETQISEIKSIEDLVDAFANVLIKMA